MSCRDIEATPERNALGALTQPRKDLVTDSLPPQHPAAPAVRARNDDLWLDS